VSTTTRTATSTTSDDRPFEFNLDAVQAERELTPFRVHFDNRRWTFAHLEELDAWEVAAAADGSEIAAVLAVLKLALGERRFTEFQKIKMPQFKLKALFDAYRKHCGQEPGEEAASSSS
jgi:hypothetical protein